jgi:hypothetical protein
MPCPARYEEPGSDPDFYPDFCPSSGEIETAIVQRERIIGIIERASFVPLVATGEAAAGL